MANHTTVLMIKKRERELQTTKSTDLTKTPDKDKKNKITTIIFLEDEE